MTTPNDPLAGFKASIAGGGGSVSSANRPSGRYYGVPDDYVSPNAPIPYSRQPPRYQTASDDDRRLLLAMPPEQLSMLQAALRQVGLINAAGYRQGIVDEQTRKGFAELLGFANQQGRSWEEALVQYSQAGVVGTDRDGAQAAQRKEAKFNTQLNTYSRTDPARLRLTAEGAFAEALGRKPKPAELAKFVKKFQDAEFNQQRTAFTAQDDVMRGNLEREQAGYDREFAEATGATAPAVDGRMTGEQEPSARLGALMADAPGKVTVGSGKRTRAQQQVLYDRYLAGKGNLAAKPGTSKHETGEANDLQYQDAQTRQWVLDNAHKYGLVFPVRGENWHVEVAHGQKAQFGPKAGARLLGTQMPANAPDPSAARPAGDGLLGGQPLSTNVSITQADLGAQATEYARNVNPVETQAYGIGQQFQNFVGLLQKGVV